MPQCGKNSRYGARKRKSRHPKKQTSAIQKSSETVYSCTAAEKSQGIRTFGVESQNAIAKNTSRHCATLLSVLRFYGTARYGSHTQQLLLDYTPAAAVCQEDGKKKRPKQIFQKIREKGLTLTLCQVVYWYRAQESASDVGCRIRGFQRFLRRKYAKNR